MKKDIDQQTPAKAKLQFTSRLSPKKDAEPSEDKDLGIAVVSELEIRLPVAVAAGRTGGNELT